jgi:hypothetical protein
VLSARGGLVELLAPPSGTRAVRVEFHPGEARSALALDARVVRAESGRLALSWQQSDPAALASLAELVAARRAAAVHAAGRRSLWERLQAVRAAR